MALTKPCRQKVVAVLEDLIQKTDPERKQVTVTRVQAKGDLLVATYGDYTLLLMDQLFERVGPGRTPLYQIGFHKVTVMVEMRKRFGTGSLDYTRKPPVTRAV